MCFPQFLASQLQYCIAKPRFRAANCHAILGKLFSGIYVYSHMVGCKGKSGEEGTPVESGIDKTAVVYQFGIFCNQIHIEEYQEERPHQVAVFSASA